MYCRRALSWIYLKFCLLHVKPQLINPLLYSFLTEHYVLNGTIITFYNLNLLLILALIYQLFTDYKQIFSYMILLCSRDLVLKYMHIVFNKNIYYMSILMIWNTFRISKKNNTRLLRLVIYIYNTCKPMYKYPFHAR